MMKWIIGIYIACVIVFLASASTVLYVGLKEISEVGLESFVQRIWYGPRGKP